MFVCQIDDVLQLRLLEIADAPELFALTDANRADLRQWLPWLDAAREVADTQSFIESTLQQFANREALITAICDDRSIVGTIGFNQIDWNNRSGYIGYWLAASHQGRGIMTKSCQSLIEYAFTTLDLNRLVIACASENHRSRAIPTRLGFKYEGTIRQVEWLYDRYVDHEIYTLFHREWHSQKG